MERKNLKEKALFLLCLGALAGNINTMVYTQENLENVKDYTKLFEEKYNNKDYTEEINDDKTITTIKISENNEVNKGILVGELFKGKEKNPINMELSFDNEVKINDNGIVVDNGSEFRSIYENITVQFNENLSINNKNGYALYNNTSSSGGEASASIIINEANKNNLIKIIGNIKAMSYNSKNKSEIKLNLNGEGSFFAGKMETEEKYPDESCKASIEMNLKDKATWYAQRSNESDIYTIDGTDKNLRTIITSDDGIIDIYNSAPNKARTEKETRTFTLNGVGDRLQNTTFRISTNVENKDHNKRADKIVLNDVDVSKDKEIYFIEIAADPFAKGKWKLEYGDKILVMDINSKDSNVGDLDKITVKGKESEAEIGAGLVKQKITPTIEEDKNNKGDWYLTGIDKVESKGDGHIFAELGVGANAGMAAAWRADNGDLYQRMGNLRNNEAQQGVWGRIYTGENEVRKGIGLDLKYRAVQVGYDRKNSISDGKLFTGVAFGYFDGNVDYDHGSGESNSATVGAYATYLGRNGAYSDFIVKFGNIDNKLSYSSDNGNYYKADFDTYGLSADAEYGYRYDFNNNYYIEPLAQLSYIYIADKDYTMKLNGESGAKVSNDDYQSLIGYTGFHYGKKFDDSVVYLRAVLAHEFAGDIDVNARYENTKVNSSISGEDTWVEYGVGFDVKVKEDTAIYGRVQRTTGDVVKNKWHASVGIRYTF